MILKGPLIILSHFLRVNLVDSFSPPFPELIDVGTSGQGNLKARDDDVTPQSNGAEDFLADSILSYAGPPTSLVNQLPQSPTDVPLIAAGIDQPSTLNDQSNPLEPSDSKSLALDTGDIPTIPAIPFIGGSEDMNYGPNILQQIQQMWQNPFDVHNQLKPECKQRMIPWGDPSGKEILAKMFAMCCGPVPKTTGPGSTKRLRVPWRRTLCYLWTASEKCTPSTIYCCFCKNEKRTAFECAQYYTDEGVPAVTAPNPGRLKRKAISMTRRQDDIVANGAFSMVDSNDPMSVIAATLPSQPATAEDKDNSDSIAMELGGTAGKKKILSPDGRNNKPIEEWTCTAEYVTNMGGTPRRKPGSEVEPPPYEEWDPTDEDEDDYSDMTVPENLPGDFYW